MRNGFLLAAIIGASVPLVASNEVANIRSLHQAPDVTNSGISNTTTDAPSVENQGHKQPNILLLFPDEWRFDWDGIRNNSAATGELHVPNLRKYAAQGTRFEHAYVPAPVCSPSRSCLAAGREYDKAGVPSNFQNDYPINQTTFYTQLQNAGYYTIATGKDDLTKATQLGSRIGQYLPNGGYHLKELGFTDGIRHSGKDDVIDKYPDPHEAYGYFLNNFTFNVNGTNFTGFDTHHKCMKEVDNSLCNPDTYPDHLYEDNWVAANAIKLLQRKPKDKPWFMHVSFPGPHPPFLVTATMGNSVASRRWPQPVDGKSGTCHNNQRPNEPQLGPGAQGEGDRCNYGAEIENIDRLFALVLAEVEHQGELDNTIVCITSDHGDMLGDHNTNAKSKPWEASISVPLLCFGPGVKEGVVVDFPVATMDLAATFIDYAGAQLASTMTSRSIRPILNGSAIVSRRNYISSGLDNWRLVIQPQNLTDGTETWLKYICCVKVVLLDNPLF